MTTKSFIACAAGAILACGIAAGANALAAPVEVEARAAPAFGHGPAAARGAGPRRIAGRIAVLRDPALAAIASLRAIERVYRHERREDELPGYLRGVLARTNDPTVRNYVNFRLARLGMRERDAKAALADLQRGLDENLARLR